MAKGRLVGIDYGAKRTGLAESDDMQIVAGTLCTLETPKLLPYLLQYCSKYNVAGIVVGQAMRESGEPSAIESNIKDFIKEFALQHPQIAIHRQDEGGTSKQAAQQLYAMGAKKKARAKKENIDLISAVLILQRFLENDYL